MTEEKANTINKYVNLIAMIAFTFSMYLWTSVNNKLECIEERLRNVEKQIVQVQTKLDIKPAAQIELEADRQLAEF